MHSFLRIDQNRTQLPTVFEHSPPSVSELLRREMGPRICLEIEVMVYRRERKRVLGKRRTLEVSCILLMYSRQEGVSTVEDRVGP